MKVRKAMQALGVSRDTLYRYEKQFNLQIARGPNNERSYTEDDLETIGRLLEGADDRRKVACSDAQSEAIAARKLAPKAAPVTSQILKQRIAAIMLADERCLKDDWLLCRTYYKTYFGTVNIDQLRAKDAPFTDTLTRRRREVLQIGLSHFGNDGCEDK